MICRLVFFHNVGALLLLLFLVDYVLFLMGVFTLVALCRCLSELSFTYFVFSTVVSFGV